MTETPNAKQRSLRIDDETYDALCDYAAKVSENVSAVTRDALRAYLRRHGYTFTTVVRRYGRRGDGRQPS